jgi:CPA1 family monovalent cation:H+ antiporter
VDGRVVERLRTNATFLAASLDSAVPGEETLHDTDVRLRGITLNAERAAVLQARKERRYQEDAVQSVLRLIDADEAALRIVEE